MRRIVLAITVIAGATAIAADPAPSADEQAVLAETNKERKAAGLGELKFNPLLMKVARDQAAVMAKEGKLGHDVGGKSFAVRVRESGYLYTASGENIAEGYKTAADAIAGWMSDPPHKKNLLGTAFTEIGVGVATAADGSKYWAQDFGTPAAEK